MYYLIKKSIYRHALALWLSITMLVPANFVFAQSTATGAQAFSASVYNLPQPDKLIASSKHFSYPILRGIKINPDDPFRLDFIIDPQDTKNVTREDTDKLINYFLACLTIPEDDLWVNLSPYESDRIISDQLSHTDLGKDLLGEDYVLKQLASSLTYPETTAGKQYWREVLGKNGSRAASANFNKVWIVPDQAQVYEYGNFAYTGKMSLKVLTEEDYLAMQKNGGLSNKTVDAFKTKILPLIDKEVNHGEHFARLRQIYNSFALAVWFKRKLGDSLFENYIGKNKVDGITLSDKNAKEKIYNLYVKAFEKGVYNYVKKEPVSPVKVTKRQYFSGGCILPAEDVVVIPTTGLGGVDFSPRQYSIAAECRLVPTLAVSSF